MKTCKLLTLILTFLFLYSCKKDEIGIYSNGLATFKDKNSKKIGFIDKNGEIVIPIIYDYASSFNNGFSSVQKDSKWGIIDTTGKVIIPAKYDDVRQSEIKDEYFIFSSQGKVGLLNNKNEIIIPSIYKSIRKYYKEGYFEAYRDAKNENNLDLYDTLGKKVATGFNSIEEFYNNRFAKLKYLASTLEPYPEYKVYDLHNTNNKLNFIKPLQHTIGLLNKFEDEKNYLFQVHKSLIVNFNGDTILPVNIYDEFSNFSENIFVAKYGKKYGFIDRKGNLIIKPIFDSADKVKEGIAQVSLNSKYFFIDMKGNCIRDCPDEMWADYYYKLGFSISSIENERIKNKIENYIYENNFNEAISSSQDAIKLNPSYYTFYYLAAMSYYKKGILSKTYHGELSYAEDYVNKCIELNPKMLDAYFLKGNIYNEQKKYDEALKFYELVISKKARFPEVYIRAANLYNKKGDKLKSCELINVACNLGLLEACQMSSSYCY